MDVDRIRELQTFGKGKLTVLPGIELRSELGSKPIHYISIFPEDCDLEHIWTTLQGKLGLTATAIEEKGGDESIYVLISDGANAVRDLGGVVSIHAGSKSNSIEGISNKEQFQQRIKFDVVNDLVDLMEIGQIKDIDVHMKKIFPDTGLDKPLILCSGNHKATNYVVKAPLWLHADATFRGLLMVLREPRERVYIGDRPPDMIRVEQNRTKYIRSLSFQRKTGAPANQQWMSGSIQFNTGLVAIVGNKGSGKSALADTLGLLGATKNEDGFSILSPKRFRHPRDGFAKVFEATIEWESGDSATKCLADSIKQEEVERIKYLPQEHVETVCNELANGEQDFERELKAVIFSHVPEAERLGQTTLDELVQFQTKEKQKRIDTLVKQLREHGRSRAALEAQADPVTKLELLEKIKRRQAELEAHDKAKPAEVANPAAGVGTSAPNALLEDLSRAEETKKTLTDKIAEASKSLRGLERRHAIALRLLEKLDNFQKEFDAFKASLGEDATELGLRAHDLVILSIHKTEPENVRDKAATDLANTKRLLDGATSVDAATPPGLWQQLATAEERIAELQSRLDAPNRAYQAYLKAVADWEAQRAKLEGTDKDSESLKGLQASLAALDKLPEKINKARDEQVKLSLQVHAEKIAKQRSILDYTGRCKTSSTRTPWPTINSNLSSAQS